MSLQQLNIAPPILGTGLQAARRLKSSCSFAKNETTCNEQAKPPQKTKRKPVPVLPCYLDRMMPLTALTNGGLTFQVTMPSRKAPVLVDLTCYSPNAPPWMVEARRGFKIRDKSSTDNKKNAKESEYVAEAIQKVLKDYKLPAKSSALLRLGMLEGMQLNRKDEAVKKKSFAQELLENLFGVTFVIGVLLMIVYVVVSAYLKVSGKSNKFKSASQAGVMSDIRFADVCGVDEAKEELVDIVEYLRDPARFTQIGAKLPKGILLVGPPGTGKTLLAKAVAGEAGVPFFYAAGSEFDEMFVGIGALRVRQLFENARAQAPAIVFIDEIDACGSARTNSSLQPYARQTINQLLQEMDGFTKTEPVIVLGATNTGDVLDKALTRPGRFDTQIQVMLPDVKGRKEIFELYLSRLAAQTAGEEINVERLASLTIGMTGADISNIVNQAALQAAKLNKLTIGQAELEFALDKARMGPESKSRVRTEKELQCTAYHEAGHALIAYYTPAAWNIYKATIRQRGPALGHVSQIPAPEDERSMTKEKLCAMIDVCMGGRVAEELLYGESNVSTGASSDIQTATKNAYQLVCEYGMSDKLGLMTYKLDALSEETKRTVEVEVKRFLQASHEKARKLLTTRAKEHKLLSDALIRYETLTMDEIRLTLENRDLDAVGRQRRDRERAGAEAQALKKATQAAAKGRAAGGGGGGDFGDLAVPVIDYVPPAADRV